MTSLWPWVAVAALGAFHGINPAMGWLFAVALGLHRKSRGALWLSLAPIAAGHALSIAAVAAAVVMLGVVIAPRPIEIAAGLLLLGWTAYLLRYGHRHRVRVGMQASLAGLTLWSFLMASAHGAGLMLVPIVVPLCLSGTDGGNTVSGQSLPLALGAVAVHTGALLAVTAAIAAVVYEWAGLEFLRRGWLNLDRLWIAALAATGVFLLS